MTEYVVLIIGDEERWWDRMTEEEAAAGMAAHERFAAALEKGGHLVTRGAELHRTSTARSLAAGSDVVTDGPYTETVEQLGGFYLVETDDLDGLMECCKIISATGDGIEVRPTVSHDS